MKYLAFLIPLFLISCNNSESKIISEKTYIDITGSDSSTLTITRFKSIFHGKLEVRKPGKVLILGEVNGKVQGDTLIGDNLYQPFKSANKKRMPFVLLEKDGKLLEGTGIVSILLGVPYYLPGSLGFDKPKRTFVEVKE